MTIVNNRQFANRRRKPARFKPATRGTLSGQIADRLSEAIRSGQLRAGTRLIEKNIAEEMETSRGPIREALRQLAEIGLVDIRPHRGAVVSLPNEDELADLVLMRAVLEATAARLICNGRGEIDINPLTAIVAKMHTAADARRSERLRDLDWLFHREIVRLSGSQQLAKCWNMMRDGLGLIMSSGRKLYATVDGVAESHAEMVDVLRSGTPAEAERYFRVRLLNSGFRWLGRTPPEL